jgi:uncharacterized protein (DUF4415 family)
MKSAVKASVADFWIDFQYLNKWHFVMQKRGRPPAAVPTEQVTVRLPREWLEHFRQHGSGVSAEIQERLYRSLLDEQREQKFRVFAGKMEKLSSDVHHALGAHWYEDRKAHLVFIEAVRRLLADLPVPASDDTELPMTIEAAANLLYRRYANELHEIQTTGQPKPRATLNILGEPNK